MKNLKRLRRRCVVAIIGCVVLCLCSTTLFAQAQNEPQIVSEYAYVLDLHDGEVVYQKNAEERMYPASLTKIMTVLVALEEIDNLNETVHMDEDIFEGLVEAQASVAGYEVNDIAYLKDLLYGIMLPSGADASRAIAKYVAGSEEEYVVLMNEKASAMGLTNTHFVNTSGLHDDAHYSTAKDIGILLQKAMENETFAEIFATNQYTTQSMDSHPEGIRFQSTRLRHLFDANLPNFLQGSKTGFTLEGGLCLASTIKEEGLHFLMVTGNAGTNLESAQHFKDTYTLYTYVLQTYRRSILFANGEEVGRMPIKQGTKADIPVVTNKDIYILDTLLDKEYTLNWEEQQTTAPIEKGDVLGQAVLSYDDKEVERFDVFASLSMEQSFPYKILSFLISVPGIVIMVMLVCVWLYVYRLRRIRRKRNRRKKIHR